MAAKPFNEALPHGIVSGLPGIRFMQNGAYYNPKGGFVEWVDGEPAKDPEPEPVVIDENGAADNVPLEELHHKTLRKMVEDAGGIYTNKPEAIAFLSAL